MQQLLGLFSQGANQYMEASLFGGWIACILFGMLSVFSIMYYLMRGKEIINGKKALKTEQLNAYASLIGSIVSPLAFIFYAHSLYIIYTNPVLKLFEAVF